MSQARVVQSRGGDRAVGRSCPPVLDAVMPASASVASALMAAATRIHGTADRIMDHTGHHSFAMVRVYTRRADAFADHAGEGLL